MEAGPRLLLVVVASFMSMSTGGAAVINVKSYGAQGNGVNDDTKVGAFFLRLSSDMCPSIQLPALLSGSSSLRDVT